jgi:hypothetical protein
LNFPPHELKKIIFERAGNGKFFEKFFIVIRNHYFISPSSLIDHHMGLGYKNPDWRPFMLAIREHTATKGFFKSKFPQTPLFKKHLWMQLLKWVQIWWGDDWWVSWRGTAENKLVLVIVVVVPKVTNARLPIKSYTHQCKKKRWLGAIWFEKDVRTEGFVKGNWGRRRTYHTILKLADHAIFNTIPAKTHLKKSCSRSFFTVTFF